MCTLFQETDDNKMESGISLNLTTNYYSVLLQTILDLPQIPHILFLIFPLLFLYSTELDYIVCYRLEYLQQIRNTTQMLRFLLLNFIIDVKQNRSLSFTYSGHFLRGKNANQSSMP